MSRPDGEPTEEPTPQRLLKSRQRGQVAISRDLSSALAFLALVAVLMGVAPAGFARLLALFRHSLARSPAVVAGAAGGSWLVMASDAASMFAYALAVPLGAAMLVALAAGLIQTGGLFSWQAAGVDLSRLSPAAGLKRLLGPQMVAEMLKGLLKIMVVALVATSSLAWGAWELPRLAGARPGLVLSAMGLFTKRLGIHIGLALVALGTLDWLLTRRRHRLSLMMTREEVKREHKESEGDPRHRSERQRLHRELSDQRSEQQMIDQVRKADFVVVNPHHIAVAIRYDRDVHEAPQVVAKGERLLAERIKQVAREAGVPIYRDVGLARALNDLPEGDEIPEVLYEAVAELLRVLWEFEHGRSAPGQPPKNEAPPNQQAVADLGGALGGAGPSHAVGAPSASAPTPLSGPGSPSTWKRV